MKLGDDGFRIAVRDGKVVLFGSKKRGALFAVYELLERFAGCRWYSSWHSVIPKRERVSLPANFDDTQTPAFAMRQPFFFDMTQHHGTCPQCAAVDAEEGSHAGTMVRFVNAIAEVVEKEFPNVFIETLAYQYSHKPPKKTRLRHNVVPCLCSIECEFAYPLNRSPYPPLGIYYGPNYGWFTDEFFEWAADLWAKAETAVKDDPVISYNVRMGAFSVDYARLERLRTAKRDIAKQRELAKSLLARFDEAKTSFTKLPIRLTNSNGARGVQIRKEWRRLLAEPAENRP